jgi:2,5-diketo-D-gluconate reductase A
VTIDLSTPLALHDGTTLARLGLGVYKVAPGDAARLVTEAIRLGYRHVDTAALYGNEREVGAALARAADLTDEPVTVTSKVWNDDHGFDATLRAFERSRALLGRDVVDLYLIHWPVPSQDRYVESWRALVRLQQEGRVRSIGVSNFHPAHLERIVGETGVVPVLDQVELHPRLPQREVRAYDDVRGIVTQSWSPLARGRLLDDPTLAGIAARHGRSVAQVVIRWHLEQGLAVIPKTSSPERLAENLAVLDFALDPGDLAAIDALASGERTGRDPDRD